jgi:catechol 2,3-dioxygenase-like lactoylglutathione lyase family enzyme
VTDALLDHPIAFLACSDAAAARDFYRDRLGLACVSDAAFALVFHVGPIELRIQKVERLVAPEHTVFGWAVADIEVMVSRLEAQGVTFDRFDAIPQDPLGIWTTPDGTRVAWFRDPDGNRLSLTQYATP